MKNVVIIERAANGYILSSPTGTAKIVATSAEAASKELGLQLLAHLDQDVIPQPGMVAIVEVETRRIGREEE